MGSLGFGVQDLGFRVSGFGIKGLWLRTKGLGALVYSVTWNMRNA